jgi:hypothetical protein
LSPNGGAGKREMKNWDRHEKRGRWPAKSIRRHANSPV